MRSPGAGVLAGAAAVVALLALGSLGLTWVEVTGTGALGEAGDVTTTGLPGRQVAPVVAAVVPAVVALCVVALLLPGRWRLVGLAPAALVALGGAAGAGRVLARGGAEPGWTPTAGPVLGLALCVVVAGLAGWAAVRALASPASAGRAGPPDETAPGPPPDAPAAAQATPWAEPRSLWDALDEGRDPTADPTADVRDRHADGDGGAPTR